MTVLSIDIETFSDLNLSDVGVYKYVDSPNFKILLFAYSIDGGPVEVIDLTMSSLPKEVVEALRNPNIVKSAFNAQFERVCLNKYIGLPTGPWECSMIKAWTCGIGGGLASVGSAIGLSEDKGKMKEGKALIKKFCTPNKKKADPEKDVEDWKTFIEYCRRDVEVELKIREKLDKFPMLDEEKDLYALDQKINDAGILLDMAMVKNAVAIDDELVAVSERRFEDITGLDNPNSLKDIKTFILKETGQEVPSITKGNLDDLIRDFKDFPVVVEVLKIRKLLSKTSTAKYRKMEDVVMADGRSRGNIQFYGASRTGRFAGRLIQVHNLPRNYVRDLDVARHLVATSDYEGLAMAYDDPPDIMSQCLRTAIVPPNGYKFAVADFSAIEARVVAWFAGEDWVLDVFRTTGKIYEATAARMFHVPVETIDKGSDMRQRGKVATLALGYQGSVGALKAMGAIDMGIPEEELQSIVDMWREANKNIVNFWYETQRSVMEAIKTQKMVTFTKRNLKAFVQSGILWIQLPSGRRLAYARPRLGENKWGGESIIFHDRNSAGTGWIKRETYGGSLVENIVQATARDILGYSMLALDKAGYKLVFHVHDEVIAEVPEDFEDLEDFCEIMGRPPEWALDLPLNADGYECSYYQKD